MLISDIKSKPYPPRKTDTTQTVQSFKAITDGALQKHSIGISPLRHPTELPHCLRRRSQFAFGLVLPFGKSIAYQAIDLFSHKSYAFAGALNCYPLGLWLGRSIIVPICILFSTLKCSLNNRIFIITAVCFHFIVNSCTVGRYNLIALQTPGISILSLTIWKFLWYFVIFYAIIYDKQ